MEADEEGTIARLTAHRRELIDPKVAEHRGRIVKTTGDGALVEFASVVDAVRCAVEVQRAMLHREPELADDQCIRFRVGINLGANLSADPELEHFVDAVNGECTALPQAKWVDPSPLPKANPRAERLAASRLCWFIADVLGQRRRCLEAVMFAAARATAIGWTSSMQYCDAQICH